MIEIHPTAIVDPGAELGEEIVIGPYSIVEKGVTIGNGTTIASHVRIAEGTTIGKSCKISQGAVLGTEPQDLKFGSEKTYLVIGNNTTIREYATLNRATTHSYYTRIGDNCLIMSYAHVAHDCQVGNHVILANSVNLAGHVIIEDWAAIGGLTPVHQFAHVGAHSFTGGGLRVSKDVPPYIKAMGEPITYGGLNSIGLKRRGFSDEVLLELKRAYKLLYRENLTVKEAIDKIKDNLQPLPEIMHLIKFLSESERGIIR
ncbi:MAG: acyl-ACP--UDP-N-acetylglucosamine O-acyltransferase [Calditrichaceae bacterium]